MLFTPFTQKILVLQGVKITNIESDANILIIYSELERNPHSCSFCNTVTDTVHDYRTQVIKDIPAFGKTVTIILRRRRYRCPYCGNMFRMV